MLESFEALLFSYVKLAPDDHAVSECPVRNPISRRHVWYPSDRIRNSKSKPCVS